MGQTVKNGTAKGYQDIGGWPRTLGIPWPPNRFRTKGGLASGRELAPPQQRLTLQPSRARPSAHNVLANGVDGCSKKQGAERVALLQPSGKFQGKRTDPQTKWVFDNTRQNGSNPETWQGFQKGNFMAHASEDIDKINFHQNLLGRGAIPLHSGPIRIHNLLSPPFTPIPTCEGQK